MYTSTRKKLNIDASEAIIRGISEEGGLFIFHHIKPFLFNKNFYKNLGTINHTNKSTTCLKLSLTSTYFMINIFLRHTECFSISIAASFVDDICKLGDFS